MTARLFEAGEWGEGGGGFEPRTYILIGRLPVPEPDPRKWSLWFTDSRMDGSAIVGADAYQRGGASIYVSTIFMAIDHNFFDSDRPPILFETMVFNPVLEERDFCGSTMECMPTYDDFTRRYSTWREAELGHRLTMALAKVEILGVRKEKAAAYL